MRLVGTGGLPGNLVQPCQGLINIAALGTGADQLDERRHMVCLGLERLIDAGAELILLALAQPGNRHSRLETCLRWGTGKLQEGIVGRDLAELLAQQQGLRQLRHHFVRGRTQILRFPELGFRSRYVTGGLQGLAEQKACLGGIRAVLQDIFELDDGRGRIVAAQVVLCRRQERIRAVATTCRHQQGHGKSGCGNKRAGNGSLHGRPPERCFRA